MIMTSGCITSRQIEKMWKWYDISFSWAPKSMGIVTETTKLKDACSSEKAMKNLDSVLKQRHHFADKVHIVI